MRGRWLALAGALILGIGVAGCGGSSTAPGQWSDPTKITYYPGLHVDLSRMTKTASGVFYWDSIQGTGAYAARPGDQITAHYTLWLPDGTLVDNAGGQALTVTLSSTAANGVIQGWVDGLSGSVQGTTRQLLIPPALGYGALGSGKIPGNTTLVFLVRVDQITPASSGDMVPVQRISQALLASGAAARFR